MKKASLIILIFLLFISVETKAQNHLVIVSSYPEKTTAENEVEQLKESGFINAGYVYHQKSKRYRVYINRFETKELAKQEAEKYKNKFQDSWIAEGKPVVSVQESINSTNINQVKSDLINTQKSIGEVLNEISLIKSEISDLKTTIAEQNYTVGQKDVNLEEKINKLNDYILEIEKKNQQKDKEIKLLNENIAQIGSDYIKSSDTVAVSRKLAHNKFDFGDHKLSFTLGATNSTLFSAIDPDIQSYFNIHQDTVPNSFFGINLGGAFNFSPKFCTEVNLKTYFYNGNFYFFPYLDLKFTPQLGYLPLKFKPSFAVGTEVQVPKTGNMMAARYMFLAPGAEVEFGINKTISIVAKAKYNIIADFNNNKFELNSVKCLDISLGIQFSIF